MDCSLRLWAPTSFHLQKGRFVLRVHKKTRRAEPSLPLSFFIPSQRFRLSRRSSFAGTCPDEAPAFLEARTFTKRHNTSGPSLRRRCPSTEETPFRPARCRSTGALHVYVMRAMRTCGVRGSSVSPWLLRLSETTSMLAHIGNVFAPDACFYLAQTRSAHRPSPLKVICGKKTRQFRRSRDD